jgi:hypothetical protein
MRKLIVIPLLLVCAFLTTHAQPGKTPANPATKVAIKDTFAFYLLSTLDKVLRIAEDPSKHPMLLAGEHIRTHRTGEGIYQSTIAMPGAITSELKFVRTFRKEGRSNWQWVLTIADTPKGKDPRLSALVQKIDTLIKNFDSRTKASGAGVAIYTNSYINTSWKNRDQIYLTIGFSRKIYNTEQGAIDSLISLYHPLLSDKTTAQECAEKFAYAITIEGFEHEKARELFTAQVLQIVDKNVPAAFQVMMGAPFFIDVKEIKAKLSPSQQEQVVKMAQQVIGDYDKHMDKLTRKDVVVEKKKEIEKEKPPSDPCEKRLWDLKIKPGYYVQGNGHIAYVREYSCATNTFSIAYQDPKQNNKLVLKSGISYAGMKAYSYTSSAPFIICSHCQGAGHSMEYDWYQMGVGSNFYAQSNKQRKYTCGVCKGSGYIKVR